MTTYITLRDVVERLCTHIYESAVSLIIKLQDTLEHEIRTRIIRNFVIFYKKKLFQLHALVSWLGSTSISQFFEAYNNFLLHIDLANNFFVRSLDEMYFSHSTLFSMRKRNLSVQSSMNCLVDGRVVCLPRTIQSFGCIYKILEKPLVDGITNWSNLSLGKALLLQQHRADFRQYLFELNHGVMIVFVPDVFMAHFVALCNSLRPWKILSLQFGSKFSLWGSKLKDMNNKEQKSHKEFMEMTDTFSFPKIFKKCFHASFRYKLENLVSSARALVRREILGDWIHGEPGSSTTFGIWKNKHNSNYQFYFEFQDIGVDNEDFKVQLKPYFGTLEHFESIAEIFISSNVWFESARSCLPKQLIENFTTLLSDRKLRYLQNRLRFNLHVEFTIVQECNSLQIYFSNVCQLRLLICKDSGVIFVQPCQEYRKCDKFRSAMLKFQDELNNMQSDNQFLLFLLSYDDVADIIKPVETWLELQKIMVQLVHEQSIDKTLPFSTSDVGERQSLCWWDGCTKLDGDLQSVSEAIPLISIRVLKQLELISVGFYTAYESSLESIIVYEPNSIQKRFRKQLVHFHGAIAPVKYHRSLSSIGTLKRLSILCWGALTSENNIIFHHGGELVHVNWDYLKITVHLFTYSKFDCQMPVMMSNIVESYAAAHKVVGLNKYCQLCIKYDAILNSDLMKITFQKCLFMQNSSMKSFDSLLQQIYYGLCENINLHFCHFVNELAAVVSLYRCIVNFFVLVANVRVSFIAELNDSYLIKPTSCGKSLAGNMCIHFVVHFYESGSLFRLSPCGFFSCEIYCDLEQADYGISFRNCVYEEICRVAPHEINFESGEKLLKSIVSQVICLEN